MKCEVLMLVVAVGLTIGAGWKVNTAQAAPVEVTGLVMTKRTTESSIKELQISPVSDDEVDQSIPQKDPIFEPRMDPSPKPHDQTESTPEPVPELIIEESETENIEQYYPEEGSEPEVVENNGFEAEEAEDQGEYESCTCFDEAINPGDAHDLISLGKWTITAYCPCEICNGGYQGTASGADMTAGRTAASNSLPLGTHVMINEHEYVIEDTGYTPFGDSWIDIFFDTHQEALEFGIQEWEVYVIE